MESSVAGRNRRRPLVESPWARGALVLAVVEAVLIVVGVIPRWVAVVVAALVLVAYFLRGRSLSSASARQAAWALAMSQAIVLLVPLVLWILGALAVLALAAVAAAVIVLLVLDR